MRSHDNIVSDYLNQCFLDLNKKVKDTVKKLKPHIDRFDAIVVRGTSGLLVGPMVASLLKTPWCIVRKPGDGTHSDHKVVEGWKNFKTYIIIDDLVASGGTLKLIQQVIRDRSTGCWDSPAVCVGFYLYNSGNLVWRGDGKNFCYEDKYFLFPEARKRPTVSEQIAGYLTQGQTAAVATS